MSRRATALTLLAAIVGAWLGWRAAWYVAVDSCLDMGHMWENRGWYCAGALNADEKAAATRR